MHPGPFDLALIGGGLQNAVILLAALHHRPESRILMVEREERLGGNHTWSFHTAAIKAEDSPFIEPLVAARWPRHRVLFPEHERGLEQPYASILSDRLDEVVRREVNRHPGSELVTTPLDRARVLVGRPPSGFPLLRLLSTERR